MSYLLVSIGVKKDISSILLMKDGRLIKKDVVRIKDEHILSSNYLCLIDSFARSLRLVRQQLEKDDTFDRTVVFEVNNSRFIKWMDDGYSKDAYQKEFMEALDLLQELPIKYNISFTTVTKAYTYAHEKYLSKVKMSGLDLLVDDEEGDSLC